MNKFLLFSFLLLGSSVQASVSLAAATTAASTLVVIDPMSKTEFENLRKTEIEKHLSGCRTCQMLNLTPYNAAGQFEPSGLKRQLQQVPREHAVVLVLWNKKFDSTDQGVVDQIRALAAEGVLFVATAGRPEASGATLGLRKTLWGQLPEIVIIGELTERERLLPGTFFGPEMLTAIKPPSNVMGQDGAAMIFSTRLVSQLRDKKSADWIEFLRNKKAASKRMWPGLEEFFGR